jgi:hypothetical protein
MKTADRAEPAMAQLKKERVQEKIEGLKQQMHQLKQVERKCLRVPTNNSRSPIPMRAP